LSHLERLSFLLGFISVFLGTSLLDLFVLPPVHNLPAIASSIPEPNQINNKVSLPKQEKKASKSKAKKKKVDNRINRIRRFLNSYKSPLAPYSELIVAEADRNRIDWRLVAVIAIKESTGCRYRPALIKGNCWGVLGFKPKRHIKYLGSLSDGIRYESRYLRTFYYDRGLTNPYSIGKVYCPPTWQEWANAVQGMMNKI